MMRSNQTVLVLAPALILGACGGSIDLQSPRPSDSPAGGGSGTLSAAGKAQQMPAGNAAGEPQASQGVGGKIEPPAPAEDTAGAAGAPAPVGDEQRAFLA